MNTYHNQTFFCVIMPFGNYAQVEERQEVIREAAKAHGFTARFPEFKRGTDSFDLHSTLKDFKQASFILADLSFERPSCYYELGVAEAIGAKVYLFALKGTDIHQTSNRETIQFYEDLEHLGALVSKIFKQVTRSSKA